VRSWLPGETAAASPSRRDGGLEEGDICRAGSTWWSGAACRHGVGAGAVGRGGSG
jgi:hypothetical protein